VRVLVASKETQGQRANDYCCVPHGELVMFGSGCDRDQGDPDGPCGCLRGMIGGNVCAPRRPSPLRSVPASP